MLAAIVHVADAIVHALDLAGDADEVVPPLSGQAWDAMKLNEEAYLHLFQETEQQFEEMSAILDGRRQGGPEQPGTRCRVVPQA